MNWNSNETRQLTEALLSLETADEAERFLRDLLTEGEIGEFSKRLSTARMLSEKIPYSTIARRTGYSSTTIARVSKWLNTGKGGYKEIIKKLHRTS